jgi:hypothetical protein
VVAHSVRTGARLIRTVRSVTAHSLPNGVVPTQWLVQDNGRELGSDGGLGTHPLGRLARLLEM